MGYMKQVERFNQPAMPPSSILNPWKLGQEIGRAIERCGERPHYPTGVRRERSALEKVLIAAGRSDLVEQWRAFLSNASAETRTAFEDGMLSTDASWNVPEYRIAWRYSAPPASGHSYNYRDDEELPGVSVVNYLTEKTRPGERDWFYRDGRALYIVGGWDLGAKGSDGEPLLHNVTIIYHE